MDYTRGITVNSPEVVSKRDKTVFNQGFGSGVSYQKERSKKARLRFKIKVILTAVVAVALTLLVVWTFI